MCVLYISKSCGFSKKPPSGFNDFTIQEDKVAEVRWFTEEELRNEIKDNPDMFLRGVCERMSM